MRESFFSKLNAAIQGKSQKQCLTKNMLPILRSGKPNGVEEKGSVHQKQHTSVRSGICRLLLLSTNVGNNGTMVIDLLGGNDDVVPPFALINEKVFEEAASLALFSKSACILT